MAWMQSQRDSSLRLPAQAGSEWRTRKSKRLTPGHAAPLPLPVGLGHADDWQRSAVVQGDFDALDDLVATG